MPEKTTRRYKTLFALLDVHFHDTFSVCEVFGRYDFVIRVWSRPKERKVEQFCKQMVQVGLGDNNRELHVCIAWSADYLGAS